MAARYKEIAIALLIVEEARLSFIAAIRSLIIALKLKLYIKKVLIVITVSKNGV